VEVCRGKKEPSVASPGERGIVAFVWGKRESKKGTKVEKKDTRAGDEL
jgi:hypothetical protein